MTQSIPMRLIVNEAMGAAAQAALGLAPSPINLVGKVAAVVEVTPANKPLIRHLAVLGVGTFNPISCNWLVFGESLQEGLPEVVSAHAEVVGAFVATLRSHGLDVATRTLTSTDALADD